MKEANFISKTLVEQKLAACVNITPKIQSRYWWKGKVETASESLLMIKTKKTLVSKLIKKVKDMHSYTVAEVIALPIIQGNPDYLQWIQTSV
jgi:periplasmic divalent cation tolerance protein